ncbi:CAP domain-containing protein [Myxosarcina sp. GI1]|uniref:CAP domain-containing protein n=1 Tax=Myxosarcina sp. GI1 TaxID=1541065 RepID=UPI000907AA1F|nr:CAP domain-containing protein [Myxosarcina sp. GI1]
MNPELINQVLKLTNAERTKAGLEPLKLNSQLVDAAQDHSNDMAEDDFFSHTGIDGSSVGDRALDSGYKYSTVGENIAAGQRTAAEVVSGWMNSPGHRANILNPNYQELGVGYRYLANDTGKVNYKHYWTQVFGTSLNNRSGGSNAELPKSTTEDPTPVEPNPTNTDRDSTSKPKKEKTISTPVIDRDINSPDTGIISKVLKLTNAERTKAGLKPLKLNSQLVDAAQNHSNDMAEDDFFSHRGIDGSSVGDRALDSGYKYSTVGENIAAGQRTAAEVVSGWMNSPGHRANILNPNYQEIGIGYEYLANDTGKVNYNHYWTQVFGSPLNSSNNDNLTGSDNSVPTGGNDAVDLGGNWREKFQDWLEDGNWNTFSKLSTNSSLGSAAKIDRDYELSNLVDNISGSDLNESKVFMENSNNQTSL